MESGLANEQGENDLDVVGHHEQHLGVVQCFEKAVERNRQFSLVLTQDVA